MLWVYALIIIILSPYAVAAQDIRFQQITGEAGLSNPKIMDVIQDQTGFIWIATSDGLNRFDGYNMKVYRNIAGDSTSISDNQIARLMVDRDGVLWVGTAAGNLNRYDEAAGSFRHWAVPSDIVRENAITALFEDSNRGLWIGTYRSGLYRFDRETAIFENWKTDGADPGRLSHNYVLSIAEIVSGEILAATYRGLNRVRYLTAGPAVIQHYYHEPADPGTISHDIIWCLSRSQADPDLIWLGTANGLTTYHSATDRFTRYTIPNPDSILFGEAAGCVLEDADPAGQTLWFGTYAGLVRFSPETGTKTRYLTDPARSESLSSNQVNRIHRDKSGVIWIATENGLNQITARGRRFNNLIPDAILSGSGEMASENVPVMARSFGGDYLFGTDNGLYVWQKPAANEASAPGSTAEKNPELRLHPDLRDIHTWSIGACRDGALWVGTYGNGLYYLQDASGRAEKIRLNHPSLGSQSVDFIKSLWCDADGGVWIGFWGLGLARLDRVTGRLVVHRNETPGKANSITHNDVWSLLRDRNGRLWVGTNGGGLNLLTDEDEGWFINWLSVSDHSGAETGNSIYSIIEPEHSPGMNTGFEAFTSLWLGTNRGLVRLRIPDNTVQHDAVRGQVEFKVFDHAYGLADRSVKAILEDENGNLWVSTNSGISFFDIREEHFRNFANDDGIRGSNFHEQSALKTDNGNYFFGSRSGLNIFSGNALTMSDFEPPVVITGFQLFSDPEPRSGRQLPENRIQAEHEITLSYKQNLFSIEFAALDFNSPEAVRYAYKMAPLDDGWVETGNRRFVTFTNMRPGRYIFQVKATNADGVWSESEAILSIHIQPPWWSTKWAYLLYGIVIITGLLVLMRMETNRSTLRNELRMKRFEAQKNAELDQIKSRFFANLSHEFRTPLMLMKGPLEQLIEETPGGKSADRYQMIYRNTDKLQTLVEQLLELSQLDAAVIGVRAVEQDLNPLLKGLVQSFASLAAEHDIHLSVDVSDETIRAWVDHDKFEKIINNLMNNAFKFTKSGGSVTVSLHKKEIDGYEQAVITIEDDGIGIQESQIDRIFDRFYQAGNSPVRSRGGSGIGLSLVKELVDLHQWEISADSTFGKGTKFSITIPLRDDYLEIDKKLLTHSLEDEPVQHSTSSAITPAPVDEASIAVKNGGVEEVTLTNNTNNVKKQDTLVLLVEDSEDVRLYIGSLLGGRYKLIEAKEGAEGLQMAREQIPDLIISDVMMPGMDGMEFCSQIKSDLRTSHIPVILLTARASDDSRIEGLETGADDFLTKPFKARELIVRINNLLEQRKLLRSRFSNQAAEKTSVTGINPVEEKFIAKINEQIDREIDNVKFDTEMLARSLFLSRMQLYRKMLAVTGQSPGEYIRLVRLKRAAELLAKDDLSVTQIAYEVGYGSPAQFSRAFSRQFESSPSEYRSIALRGK
jgi:signal transduction histidine kinase/ligand-binding sensor domain-containing protein/DNA-binding response OmpR family regulator